VKKGNKKPSIEKAPKPAKSLAGVGKMTKNIHDVLHGRKVKGSK